MPAPTGRRSVLRRIFFLAALSALPFEAHGQALSADTFVRGIYMPYLGEDFKGQPFWQVSRFFAPELARAIEDDMREARRRGEVPKLDGDPFLDAQDWYIKDLAISVKADGPRAVGNVSFENLGRQIWITLDLVQTRAGWRIADIKAPSGSLSALYAQK